MVGPNTIYHVLIVLLLLASANSWCSPSDKGECKLIVRAGRNAKDEDYRSIHFLNHKHLSSGSIRVQPSSNRMSFWTGSDATTPHVSIESNGTLRANNMQMTHLHVDTINSTLIRLETLTVNDLIQTNSLQVAHSIVANQTTFATTNVTKDLHVFGGLSVRGASLFHQDIRIVGGNVHSEYLDARGNVGRSGAYLDARGSVEIYSDSNDGHIDFKSKAEEDSIVRISAQDDKLLLHGRNMVITHKGNVGIGTEPTHPLHVNGIVRAASSTITTGSDRRVKQDVRAVNATEALSKLSKIQVRDFQWHPSYKHTTNQPSNRKIGFIAQELMAIIPEAVDQQPGIETYADENGHELKVKGMHTVNMDPVIMTLISAVQALKAQVDELQQKVARCGDESLSLSLNN